MDRHRSAGISLTVLLLSADRLAERRAVAAPGAALGPLADSIAADLEQLMARELYVPREKALLSREGGRCADDGTQLEFDPWSPDEHRCPRCGRVYKGEFHHRWWVYWYQLWLAERGVHAALLHLLRGEARHGALAAAIAERYCAAYVTYPNRDNVLGPTRPFFSTYLESIWLLQLVVTADLLEAAGDRVTSEHVRDQIVRPSAALIAQYDEGVSNRQVWNNAAMMAAALLLGDRARAEEIVRAPSGVEQHLATGLLDDGTWYEGENYHLFAHRGLWYCMTLAETAGIAIDPTLTSRFQEGFAAPFATALPDFTLPSRKDSPYAVSLRQARFAELCELGLARYDDDRLTQALAELYSNELTHGDSGRATSTADVERNLPGTGLTRADLGWRSLLHARAELPALERRAARSVQLAGQGISVFRRREGHVYVALDWGQSGGGHGHPDRLNLLFSCGSTRWLDDLGTGSYVDPSLHWYRSTLAHNAPLVDGCSQLRADGALIAYEEREEYGWIAASADGIAPGVFISRAVMVTDDYFVDEVRWRSADRVQFDLPLHFDGALAGAFAGVPLDDGDPLDDVLDDVLDAEDGFGAVWGARSREFGARTTIELAGERDDRAARAFLRASGDSRLFRVNGPGQPATAPRPFYVLRCEGEKGVVRSVWAWSPSVRSVRFPGNAVEVEIHGERDEGHVHQWRKTHWEFVRRAGGAQRTMRLKGFAASDEAPPDLVATIAQLERSLRLGWMPGSKPGDVPEPTSPRIWVTQSTPIPLEIGEVNYRRSEQTWEEAGRPSAVVTLRFESAELVIDVNAAVGAPVIVPPDATNLFDNEHPDINGHGVQLYVATEDGGGAWVIVPDAGSAAARLRPLSGWGALDVLDATWQRTEAGFSMHVRTALPPVPASRWNDGYPVAVDVIVNETEPGRDRRRGQLVLSGAFGEFVYLRGDRHEARRLWRFMVVAPRKRKRSP